MSKMSTPARADPQAKPGDAGVHLNRATALYERGDLDGAIAELREAIRLKPDLAKPILALLRRSQAKATARQLLRSAERPRNLT